MKPLFNRGPDDRHVAQTLYRSSGFREDAPLPQFDGGSAHMEMDLVTEEFTEPRS